MDVAIYQDASWTWAERGVHGVKYNGDRFDGRVVAARYAFEIELNLRVPDRRAVTLERNKTIRVRRAGRLHTHLNVG